MTAPTDPARYGPPSSTIKARVVAVDLENVLGRLSDMGINATAFSYAVSEPVPVVKVDPPHPEHPLRNHAAETVWDSLPPAARVYEVSVGGAQITWEEADEDG